MTPPRDDESTGLPGLRSWRAVYWTVVVVLGAWVVALYALSAAYA
ncbi:MAG TPA: hypothetical protein VGG37_03910 [Opitutaceae bacterium]|jgi:hypothetical protein